MWWKTTFCSLKVTCIFLSEPFMTWTVCDLKPLWPFYYLMTVRGLIFCLLNLQRKLIQICFLCLNSCLKPRLQNQSELAQTTGSLVLLYKILAFDCSPSTLWDPCDSLCWSFLQKAPIKIHREKFGNPASCVFRFPSQYTIKRKDVSVRREQGSLSLTTSLQHQTNTTQ